VTAIPVNRTAQDGSAQFRQKFNDGGRNLANSRGNSKMFEERRGLLAREQPVRFSTSDRYVFEASPILFLR